MTVDIYVTFTLRSAWVMAEWSSRKENLPKTQLSTAQMSDPFTHIPACYVLRFQLSPNSIPRNCLIHVDHLNPSPYHISRPHPFHLYTPRSIYEGTMSGKLIPHGKKSRISTALKYFLTWIYLPTSTVMSHTMCTTTRAEYTYCQFMLNASLSYHATRMKRVRSALPRYFLWFILFRYMDGTAQGDLGLRCQ
ncbi:hypothetical protein BJX62DRAFT_126360 [Aspergillus germanicus]